MMIALEELICPILKPLALYARVSRDKKEAKKQKATLIQYAEEVNRGYTLYYDECSGKTDDRPQYIKMVQAIKEGDHTEVIVTKVDRLSRNLLNGCHFLKLLVEDKNGIFRAIEQSLNSESVMLLDTIRLFLWIAEIEGRGITDRIHDGQAPFYDKDGKLTCNPGNINCKKSVLTPQKLAEVLKWRKAELNKTQISKICGISRPAVNDAFRMLDGEIVQRRGQRKKCKTTLAITPQETQISSLLLTPGDS
jgi:DNA invertase Pin-like site-specific DNA recombinase